MDTEKKVMRLSFALVISVFAIKLTVSFLTNSFSFYTELADAAMDLIVVLITRFALIRSKKPADEEHMFGHSKINTLAGLVESLLIIGVYFSIIYTAFNTLIEENRYETEGGLIAIGGLVASLVIVLIISRKIVQYGKETKNKVIIAQGLNFRGDLYRNITIIVGILISMFNLGLVDILVAISFSILSIYQSSKLFKDCVDELLDSVELPQDSINSIKIGIENVDLVDNLNDIALRSVGNHLDANISVTLSKKLTVKETTFISRQIQEILAKYSHGYKVNTFIQYDSSDEESLDIIHYLRSNINDFGEEFNIHNIFIDYFSDRILVQFHIQMPLDWDLNFAHTKATEIEEKLKDKLVNLHAIDITPENIEIISHLEPSTPSQHYHIHEKKEKPLSEIVQSLREIVVGFQEIDECKKIEAHYEKFGLEVLIVVLLRPDMSLFHAHQIVGRLETLLCEENPQIFQCTIHTEPSNVK